MLNFKDNRRIYVETIIYIETEKGSGTGFVFNSAGYAVTCAHVVKDASEIYVRIGTAPDAIQKARAVGIDEKADVAVILIDGKDYYAAAVDMEERVYLGDEIIILGFPFGSKVADDVMEMSVSYARGYVSSKQMKNGMEQVLLDISAKAGNSGSPVLSRETGKVIGVLCGSILNNSGDRLVEEINYMRPIRYINSMFED